jgi:hypothetical protein
VEAHRVVPHCLDSGFTDGGEVFGLTLLSVRVERRRFREASRRSLASGSRPSCSSKGNDVSLRRWLANLTQTVCSHCWYTGMKFYVQLFHPEEGCSLLFRNVSIFLPNYTEYSALIIVSIIRIGFNLKGQNCFQENSWREICRAFLPKALHVMKM